MDAVDKIGYDDAYYTSLAFTMIIYFDSISDGYDLI